MTFDLTDDDLRAVYARYYQSAYKVDGPRQPLRMRLILWLGVIVFAPVVLLLLFGRYEGSNVPYIAVLLCFIIVCILLSSLADSRAPRRRRAAIALDRTLKSCVLDTLVGPWMVEITPDGVRADYAAESRIIKWPGIWGFHAGPEIVSIISIDSRSVIIPLRAFPEPRAETAAAFVRRGEELLAASGHGYRSRLSAYLADHDCLCPKCRYNLRGGAGGASQGPRCPECGWLITPEHVPDAFRRAAAQA